MNIVRRFLLHGTPLLQHSSPLLVLCVCVVYVCVYVCLSVSIYVCVYACRTVVVL
jgi:hypothetical protein